MALVSPAAANSNRVCRDWSKSTLTKFQPDYRHGLLLAVASQEILVTAEGAEPFVYETSGEIRLTDTTTLESRPAGHFRIYYLDVESADNASESVFDLLD